MPTLSEKLGAYASRLKYEDLPKDVIHKAKALILDAVGCAFGGYDSEPAKIARDMAATVTSTKPATMLAKSFAASATCGTTRRSGSITRRWARSRA